MRWMCRIIPTGDLSSIAQKQSLLIFGRRIKTQEMQSRLFVAPTLMKLAFGDNIFDDAFNTGTQSQLLLNELKMLYSTPTMDYNEHAKADRINQILTFTDFGGLDYNQFIWMHSKCTFFYTPRVEEALRTLIEFIRDHHCVGFEKDILPPIVADNIFFIAVQLFEFIYDLKDESFNDFLLLAVRKIARAKNLIGLTKYLSSKSIGSCTNNRWRALIGEKLDDKEEPTFIDLFVALVDDNVPITKSVVKDNFFNIKDRATEILNYLLFANDYGTINRWLVTSNPSKFFKAAKVKPGSVFFTTEFYHKLILVEPFDKDILKSAYLPVFYEHYMAEYGEQVRKPSFAAYASSVNRGGRAMARIAASIRPAHRPRPRPRRAARHTSTSSSSSSSN